MLGVGSRQEERHRFGGFESTPLGQRGTDPKKCGSPLFQKVAVVTSEWRKKSDYIFLVCPSVSLRFGLIRKLRRGILHRPMLIFVLFSSRRRLLGDLHDKEECIIVLRMVCVVRCVLMTTVFCFSWQVRCEEGQFEVCHLQFNVRVSELIYFCNICSLFFVSFHFLSQSILRRSWRCFRSGSIPVIILRSHFLRKRTNS